MNNTWWGLIAGLITGLSTSIGALPIFKKETNSAWNPWKILNLDFAIGMMLAAATFNLIGPAYSSSDRPAHVTLALAAGILAIYLLSRMLHKFSPQAHQNHRRAWLFVIAMMLHNFPEGLASGAALSAEGLANGWTVVGAIVFQNFPEGLATAAAFLSIGLSRTRAFIGAVITGLMEVLGGTLGGFFNSLASFYLPLILALAGGAMLSVTLEEIYVKVRETRMTYLMRKEFLLGILSVLLMNWIFADF